jgi:hypothetical protein
MLNLILWVLTILSIIWTWRLINFAIRTANRIAVATETTANNVAAIYDSLPPEFKQRREEVVKVEKQAAEQSTRHARPGDQEYDWRMPAHAQALVPNR